MCIRDSAGALHDDGALRIDLVGHSLGGLVARAAAARAGVEGWTPHRLALIGSPASGAALADRLQANPLYRRLTGDCGLAVTSARAAAVPVPDLPIGVIAGGTGRPGGFNPLLDGDNDGVVRVAETRLPGIEADFLLLPSIHTILPSRPVAIAATCRFLRTGQFGPDGSARARPNDCGRATAPDGEPAAAETPQHATAGASDRPPPIGTDRTRRPETVHGAAVAAADLS